MMRFSLFNVRHGFCALAIGPNGTNTLFDCGHDDETGFRPSLYLPAIGVQNINRMVLGNFDTDHASDLHNLKDKVTIQHFLRNRTLTPDQLRFLKMQGGPISSGIKTAISMHADYVYPDADIDYAGVTLNTFYNSYPEFTDTNNLSVVSFLHYGGSCICIPGDLECKGWERLLCNSAVCNQLGLVDIFIASHHGRITGYCEKIFEYCSPAVILISDKEMVYESQKCDYAKHARGIAWGGSATEKRFVLTTRCDGNMLITKEPNCGFHLTAGVEVALPAARAASSF
jgi:beta-lactamase superfamily II metal-dependent hydrolase